MSEAYRPPAPPATRPGGRNPVAWARFWPLAVPVLGCVLVQLVIRPGAIAPRESVPYAVKWLIYDENDLTALALRGANLEAGRLPGRPKEPGWVEPADFPAHLDDPTREYSERFYLEYPTSALAVFRLGFALQFDTPPPFPPAVGDSFQYPVGLHVPRTPEEWAVWSRLGFAVRFYVVVMAAAAVGLMLVLRRGYLPGGGLSGPIWLCALPGAVFFALNRFDMLPVLATALGFACLGRAGSFPPPLRGRVRVGGEPAGEKGQSPDSGSLTPHPNPPPQGGREQNGATVYLALAGVFFAVGVLLKLYPVLFVPVILRYLGVRRSVPFLVAFAATGAAATGLSLAVLGWESTIGPIQVQLNRKLDYVQWTNYGRIFPLAMAGWKKVRLAVLATAVLAAVVTRPADLAGVLRRCGAVLVVFVSLSVFWSPQWILWFFPLTIPLAGRRRWLIFAVVALDVANYVSFPLLFWLWWGMMDDPTRDLIAVALVYIRAAIWFGMAGGLVWDEWKSRRVSAADPTAFQERLAELVEAFRRAGEQAGKPRGLAWVSAEPAGEPVFTRDATTGQQVALLVVQVQFEPLPGSELEDVPQARDPRPVTAVFVTDGNEWRTDGRAVFNLTPEQAVERSGGRFTSPKRERGEAE